jgi:putative membrane-bound dehydrogenase-like protein
MKRRIAFLVALSSFFILKPAPSLAIDAGVARVDVTPSEPIRLTGYGNRKTNNVGIEQKLWAKALALGTDREGPALLLTLDNCGIAESTYRELIARLTKKTRLKQAGIAIACSHTHSGPCTTDWAPNIFSSDISPPQQAVIDRYTKELIGKLEDVALAALKNRRPGQLSWSQGEVGFARNRRVVVGKTAQFGDNAAGPVDHALPVLKITDPDGKLRALVANYACHCTTLGGEFNHVCGDWAGYAQEAIEREHPGAVALITIGCGADANPFPRGGPDGGLALAKQHGEELAAEVQRLLGLTFTPLAGKLTTRLKEIRLPFGQHFTRDQLLARGTNSGAVGYNARKWLARLDRGEKMPDSLYYPIGTWQFGDELALVFLPGEVVVDYSLRLKRAFDPQRLWVSAYANYVPCYIPSRRILAEGGYEAEDSLWYYDRPTRISTNAEELIIKTVHELLPKQFLSNPKKAEFPDPKTPQQALGTIRTKAGFTVELVASEPLIESPVAIDWDARGRLWVCEMYDYPTGLDPAPDVGRKWGETPPGNYKPGGRIKILTDTDGDGRYDRATLFLDKLAFPTGVMPWRNGALICAAPDILFAEDTDGDGRADVVRTNYTGFATHNYQARVNGFRWGLDGWLHGSSGLFGGKIKSLITGKEVDLGGRDFRIRPDTGEIEPLAGISQMGRVRDDFDNWFGNDNSTLLWQYPLPDHYLRRNPYVTYPDPRVNVASQGVRERGSEGVGTNAQPHSLTPPLPHSRSTAKQPYDPNKLYPTSRTLERFNHPESANRVTSACGPDIYRDNLLGPEYYGNAFICEPVHNLVTRLVLEPDGVTFAGRRADDELRSEFLASTDNWFRPVQVRTGPDGALWVVDMYRFVIEHPRWIAPERLKTLDVRAGADMGRIYRVYPKGAKLRPIADLTKLPSIGDAMGRDLFRALASPNGPTRDLAQIELVVRHTGPNGKAFGSFGSRLFPMLSRTAVDPVVCVQMLFTLKQLGLANATTVSTALTNAESEVRRAALRLSEAFPEDKTLNDAFLRLKDDIDPGVRLQLALSLGERIPQRTAAQALANLARTDGRWMRAAVLSSVARSPGELLQVMLGSADSLQGRNDLLAGLIVTAVESGLADTLTGVLQALAPEADVFADAEAASKLEPWRVEAIASMFEALERRRERLGTSELKLGEGAEVPLRLIESVKRRACKLAVEPAAAEPLRLACIRLLGVWGHTIALEVLSSVLDPSTPLPLQLAAVDALARSREGDAGSLLLRCWPTLSPMVRGRVIDALLGREEWSRELLSEVERGQVSVGEVSLPQRQRLLAVKNSSQRERAARLFAPTNVANRTDVLAKYSAVAILAAALSRGAALFDTQCAQCHAYRGHGHAVGPNLAEFAGKSAADFVQAILDPNSAINPNFLAYNVETKDGRSLSGIVRGETASGLTLVQGGGVQETILRSDIQEIRASNLSLMPEGLEQALTPQDLADLIAWIKQAAPAPFGHASANPDLAAKNRTEFLKTGASSVAKITTLTETLPYRSWIGTLPMAYCRQSAGVNRLAWEAATANPLTPALSPNGGEGVGPLTPGLSPSEGERENRGAVGGRTVAFRFPAAMGFLSQPSGKFTLRFNGTVLFDFNVSLTDERWQSRDGRARMSYTVTEANAEDSCGVLRIELAADLVKPGEPARFEVLGSDSGSQRWFGIYELNVGR